MMSADFLGQWFEHRSEFFHRTKNAVLRRTRAETERAADLLDRSPLVMAQRERGALERAQTFKRLRYAPLDFRAARHPLRIRQVRHRRVHRGVERFGTR